MKYTVIYHEDAIEIQDSEGNEVLYWVEDEWVENPQVVFSIVNAAVLAAQGELAWQASVAPVRSWCGCC